MAFILRNAVEIFCTFPLQVHLCFWHAQASVEMLRKLLVITRKPLSGEAPGGHQKNGLVLTGHTSQIHPLHHPLHQSGRKGAILCNSFQVYYFKFGERTAKILQQCVHSSRPRLFCKYIKWTLGYNLGLSLFQCIKGWAPTNNKAGYDQGLSIHFQNQSAAVLETLEAHRGCLLNDNDVAKNATGNIHISACVFLAWIFMFGI